MATAYGQYNTSSQRNHHQRRRQHVVSITRPDREITINDGDSMWSVYVQPEKSPSTTATACDQYDTSSQRNHHQRRRQHMVSITRPAREITINDGDSMWSVYVHPEKSPSTTATACDQYNTSSQRNHHQRRRQHVISITRPAREITINDGDSM